MLSPSSPVLLTQQPEHQELLQRREYMHQQFQIQLQGMQNGVRKSKRSVHRWRNDAFTFLKQHRKSHQKLSAFKYTKDNITFTAVSINGKEILMETSTRKNQGKTNGKVDVRYWERNSTKPIRSFPELKRRFFEVNFDAFHFKTGVYSRSSSSAPPRVAVRVDF